MRKIHVSKNGTIRTINEALSLVNKNEPSTIIISKGTYFEKIRITSDNITIKGESPQNTIISFNDFSQKYDIENKEYNTFKTYTMIVLSNNVKIESICVENCAGSSSKFSQAVALHLMGDKIHIKNCYIKGNQDTVFLGGLPRDLIARYDGFISDDERLFPKQPRHFFEKCKISGDIDFIFGSSNAIFYNCEIISVKDPYLEKGSFGYIAAPSTPKECKHGLLFLNCSILSKTTSNSVFLARPWREHSKATFVNCYMDNHIHKEGFCIWENTDRHLTCTFIEYNSTGPGSIRKKLPWSKEISSEEQNQYRIETIFINWSIEY